MEGLWGLQMRRMLPFDCVHLYRRNIYWEPASSETDDVHFLSLYRLGSIVEVCCANRWQSAYIQTDTACVLLWQTTTRAQSTQLLWHLSDNHRLWPEDCYTSHSLSRPSTGGAISSCPLLVHPMHTLSAVNSLTSALLIWMPPLFKSTWPQPMLRITRGASRITAPCTALIGVLLCVSHPFHP